MITNHTMCNELIFYVCSLRIATASSESLCGGPTKFMICVIARQGKAKGSYYSRFIASEVARNSNHCGRKKGA